MLLFGTLAACGEDDPGEPATTMSEEMTDESMTDETMTDETMTDESSSG